MTGLFRAFGLGLGLALLALTLGSGEASTSGNAAQSAGENPIYTTFVIHFDPLPTRNGQVLREGYERERDNLAWLVSYLEQLEREKGEAFVPRLTLEIAGDHAEYYRKDPGGLALLKQLYNKGIHSFGIHFHRNYKVGTHRWVEAPQGDPEVRRRVTLDHIREVDALIAEVIGTDDPEAVRAVNPIITGHLLDAELAQEMGFYVQTGGRNEALNLFFDHDVHNPWRPSMAPGAWPLAEDLNSPWVLVPQSPVLGAIGEHAPLPPGVPPEYIEGLRWGIWQDLSIPAMQRKFLHLYLEWRHRQGTLNPAEQKVWVFGWHEHPNKLFGDDGAYGNIRNLRDEVQEFVGWLNENFIDKGIAKYASVEEVAQAFRAWEAAHPGESSFSYPVRERDWDAYPYKLKGLTRELMYAHYEREITAFRDRGVYVHELLKTDGRTWRYEDGRITSDGPTWPIYVLWSEAGEQTIDYSAIVEGGLRCVDGETGVESLHPAEALQAIEVPIVCKGSTSSQARTWLPLRTAHEVGRLANGNTLITDGGRRRVGTGSRVLEVDPQGNVVWAYEEGLNWAHSAERLPNGNTLIADTGHDRVLEVDPEGNIVWSTDDIALSDGSRLDYPNDVEQLENDRLLITDRDNHRVLEIDRDGTIVWQFGVTGVPGGDEKHLKHPHNADRLSNGHTMIADSGNDRVIEVDPSGTIVWEYRPGGRERIRFPKDADRLENGNTLITVADERNPRVLEVTPDGRVVWQYTEGLSLPYEADRLPNGHTLIAAALGGRIVEVDETGAIVWEYPSTSGLGAQETSRYLLISYNANYLWGPPARVGRADPEGFVRTLNRHLDLMDRLGIKADYYFTGLAAEKLAEWSPETVERLLRSAHGIQYHGANRPPYPQLIDQIKGEDWEEDVETAWTYEAEGVNPATGEHVGGIAAFREVFGREPFATGRFFEASILYVDKRLGVRLGVGLKDNTDGPRNDAWFLGVLNRPEQAGLSASGLERAALRGEDEQFLVHARAILTRLEGPFAVATLPIHDHDFYKHSPQDQEKVWDLYERALRLALELGYQPVTLREIYAMARNGPAPTIIREELLQAARSLIQTMESTGYPPEYVQAGGVPYSLAEVFEALARALVHYRETGSLPDLVGTYDLPGPTGAFERSAGEATISAEAVLEAAAAVTDALVEKLPSPVTVGEYTVNPAEFLYLMAQEYVMISQSDPTSVILRPIRLLPLPVIQNREADSLTKLQFWTYKPAIFTAK